MDRPNKNRNQRGTRHKIALHAPLHESWQRRILRAHRQVAAHLSLRGIRKKQRQRAKTETLQRRSDVGSKPFGRIVRSRTGETAGGFVTANLGGFCRKQWTECENLGEIRPAGRKFAGERRKHGVFSRTRLPHGRAMLPAHITVSHHAARAFYDAKLPHDAWCISLLQPASHSFLPWAALRYARRRNFPATPTGGKEPIVKTETGLRNLADLHIIVWNNPQQSTEWNGRMETGRRLAATAGVPGRTLFQGRHTGGRDCTPSHDTLFQAGGRTNRADNCPQPLSGMQRIWQKKIADTGTRYCFPTKWIYGTQIRIPLQRFDERPGIPATGLHSFLFQTRRPTRKKQHSHGCPARRHPCVGQGCEQVFILQSHTAL